MVNRQLRARGIADPRVLEAMRDVPRERFVPIEYLDNACDDSPLPIGSGQTISQPYIVAYMTEQLDVRPEHRVLEVGTGSGYQTAVLAQLCAHVYTIERIAELHDSARRVLSELGLLARVTMRCGDGSLGWPEEAPFDRVIVTAAAPQVPPALVEQLVEGGVLVAPIGVDHSQTVVRVERRRGRTVETPLLGCRFVRLIGAGGWKADD